MVKPPDTGGWRRCQGGREGESEAGRGLPVGTEDAERPSEPVEREREGAREPGTDPIVVMTVVVRHAPFVLSDLLLRDVSSITISASRQSVYDSTRVNHLRI